MNKCMTVLHQISLQVICYTRLVQDLWIRLSILFKLIWVSLTISCLKSQMDPPNDLDVKHFKVRGKFYFNTVSPSNFLLQTDTS